MTTNHPESGPVSVTDEKPKSSSKSEIEIELRKMTQLKISQPGDKREAVQDPKPKKKKQQTRTMSSFQVFSQFIEIVDGKESGEKILSKECFDLWLETRDGKVLHPEESFRRTLIAHVRGVYGRKPFSPSVEASLLKLLRETSRNNKPTNAWERCFPANTSNIGKRGFNKLGYHEDLARQKNQSCLGGINNGNGSNGRKNGGSSGSGDRSRKNSPFIITPSVCNCPQMTIDLSKLGPKTIKRLRQASSASNLAGNPEERRESKPEITAHSLKTLTALNPLPAALSLQPQNMFQTQTVQAVQVNPIRTPQAALNMNLASALQKDIETLRSLTSYAAGGLGILSELAQVITTSRSEYDIIKLNRVCQQKGFEIIPPAVAFYLQSGQYASDPRLDLNHLLPPPEERQFIENKPIGKLIFNLKTWLVEECDSTAKNIYRRDITGDHAFEFLESPLESLVCFTKFFPIICSKGQVWVRLRAVRKDNSRLGLLFKICLKDSERFLCYFQDQSHIRPHMLAIPMFL